MYQCFLWVYCSEQDILFSIHSESNNPPHACSKYVMWLLTWATWCFVTTPSCFCYLINTVCVMLIRKYFKWVRQNSIVWLQSLNSNTCCNKFKCMEHCMVLLIETKLNYIESNHELFHLLSSVWPETKYIRYMQRIGKKNIGAPTESNANYWYTYKMLLK